MPLHSPAVLDRPFCFKTQMYIGSVPFIVVADADVARMVNNRLIDRTILRQLTADPSGRDDDQMLGLAAAK